MTTMEELHTRVRALLCRESTPPPLAVDARGALALFEPPSTAHRFLPFLPAHLQHALALAARYMELANAHPGEPGLAAVLDEAERQARHGDLEWVKYALRVFLHHHPSGRGVPVPSLLERAPGWLVPSERKEPPATKKGPPGPGAEIWLDYFREDSGLSELLDAWSVRNPAGGYPDPEQPQRRLLPDGHGERFWYMHQQLLAHYDTERLAFGMPRTVPLEDYASPITEGYDAGLPGFAPRPPGMSPRGLPGYDITDHATRRDRLFTAASSGLLWQGDSPFYIDSFEQLSDTAESNLGSLDGEAWAKPLGPHGSHHNLGHVLLASLTDSPRAALPGVMASPATAARDPLFYRWHRHVDDILDTWRSAHLPPPELSDGPQVRMRKWLGDGMAPAHQSPDIIVCLHRDMPKAAAPDFDGQRWGEATFTGDSWDSPPPAFPASSQILHTRMARHTVRLPDGREVSKPQLDHEEFHYFLRVENLLPREQKVTVRILLAADAFAEDRRMWMELDTFVHTLRPSERQVIHRPSRLASVVRERGWPGNLLLPRGRDEGMLFRMMVMLTHWEPEPEPGFPFNRPLPPGQRIAELVSLPNVATRNLWFIHGA